MTFIIRSMFFGLQKFGYILYFSEFVETRRAKSLTLEGRRDNGSWEVVATCNHLDGFEIGPNHLNSFESGCLSPNRVVSPWE